MNKKGSIVFGVVFFTIMALAVLGIVLGIVSGFEEKDILDEKCKTLGYLEYEYKDEFKFCEEENGDLHYIKSECSYNIPFLQLFPKDCKMNEISI